MSVEAITWALKQPVKQSSAKFVLVALANCAEAVDGSAWPSVAYLCEATSQDRKTVMQNIKRLIDGGFIFDTGARKGSTKSIVVYGLSSAEIGTPKQDQKRDTLQDEAVPKFPISSTVFPHKQSRFSLEAVPKTVHGTVKNRNGTVKEPKTALVAPDVDPDVLADFVKGRKSKPTQTALDGIRREADKAGWTMEAALRECCARGWQGFKADWVAEKPKPGAGKETAYQQSMREKWEVATGRNKQAGVIYDDAKLLG